MASANLRRADIVKLLEEAGVAFDPEATIVQLRPLYSETIQRLAQIANLDGQADAANADANATGAASLEAQQQPQQVNLIQIDPEATQ